MKTLEQKAKAYDKAIEKFDVILNLNTVKESGTIFADDVRKIFPELKESESDDERIRKALINGFNKLDQSAVWYNGITNGQILAWLEKQGEQKLVQETEPTPIFKIGDILKRKGKDYTFRVDRIQGGYYHCDRNHGAFFPIEEQGNWELVAQKPAWSEEDETALGDALWCCKQAASIAKDENDMGNIWYAERWLKSLRPQNRWKPSDEQIKTLEFVIESIDNMLRAIGHIDNVTKPRLKEVLAALKKLREE